jgi:hypothetical protein
MSLDTHAAAPSAPQERWDLGPWENGYRQIWTPSGQFFQATVVAHVFGGDLRRERLIVAAPEMLAALEAIFDGVEDEGGGPDGIVMLPVTNRDIARARHALAKATGQ